jgi:hypothetical protein
MIVGVVSGRTVFWHPFMVAQGFGFACLLRCWWALATGRRCTFLSLVYPAR